MGDTKVKEPFPKYFAPKKEQPVTTKWEYIQHYYANGFTQDQLKRFGDLGWELVGFDPAGIAILKRPKPEETETAPEPEVSVTLTAADWRFLRNRWKTETWPDGAHFDRIDYAVFAALAKAGQPSV